MSKEEGEFEQQVNQLCESVSDLQRPFYQSDLQSFDAYAAGLSQQIKDSIISYKDHLTRGYELVLNHINQTNPSQIERYKIGSKISHLVSSEEKLLDVLEEKKVLQFVFGYDGKMMREIYEFADKLYNEKNYSDATEVFLFLISINPYICWFWQGLGKAFQAQNQFEEASNAFLMALNCDPKRLDGYRDAIRCSLEFKNFDTIDKIISYGMNVADSSEAFDSVEELKNGLATIKTYCDQLKGEIV